MPVLRLARGMGMGMGWAWLSLLCTFFGDGLGAFVPENLVRICNSRSINHTRAGQALIPLGRKKTKHGNQHPRREVLLACIGLQY